MRLINRFRHFYNVFRAVGSCKFKAHWSVVYFCVKGAYVCGFLIESGFPSFVLDDNVFDFFKDLYQHHNVSRENFTINLLYR